MKKTIKDVDVIDKRILVRVDLDVASESSKSRTPADETRFRSALRTIEYLVRERARVILYPHSNQPTGVPVDEQFLEPLRAQLSELLRREVRKVDDCVGPEVRHAVDHLPPGGVLLLGNTELHPGEQKNNPVFASELASLADLYVNDDFTAAHLRRASTQGAARHLPAVAGLSLSRQLDGLSGVLEDPERPFVAVLGGANSTDKMEVIEHLLERVDYLLVGGDLAKPFLTALGLEVGTPLSIDRQQGAAERLMERAGEKLVLPQDVVVGDDLAAEGDDRTISVLQMSSNSHMQDIGRRSVELFGHKLANARTIVWYGTLGARELPSVSSADLQIARILAELAGQTIVGGRDAVSAVERAGVAEKLTLVSPGEQAFLRMLRGRDLPAVSVLEDKSGSALRNAPAR